MLLEPGARFGAYEVAARLGAGGMGEVWRARDVRLGRDVALKLVGEAIAADPEGMARFEREAKLLASLQHPNIGMLYGLEESDGRRALVLELVPGLTLAERLAGGAMPVREALLVARQVAEALFRQPYPATAAEAFDLLQIRVTTGLIPRRSVLAPPDSTVCSELCIAQHIDNHTHEGDRIFYT